MLHNPLGATLAGVLFAVHPIHSEAVSNVTGRAEVLSALFYLLGFLVHVHCCRKNSLVVRGVAYLLLMVCTALSLFSKEQGAMLPASCVVWDLFESKITIQKLLRAAKVQPLCQTTVLVLWCCTAMRCTATHCTWLHCYVPHCHTLHLVAPLCAALPHTALGCTAMCCTATRSTP